MAGAQVYHANPNAAQQQQGPPPPKPPRKNPYRDGLSKATQHYDLYEMIRHPHLSRENRPPDAPPIPRKVPKKQRLLEKKFESKLEQQEKRSAQGIKGGPSKVGVLVTFLARAICVLFLIFVFPPYFLLYVAPRWAFTITLAALKKIDQFLTQVFESIRAKLSAFYAGIVNPIKKIWQTTKARFKSGKREKVEIPLEEMGFLAFIAHGMIQFYFSTVHPVYQFARKGVINAIELGKRIRRIPHALQNYLNDSFGVVKSWTTALKKRFSYYLQKLFKRVQERVLGAVEARWTKWTTRMSQGFDRLVAGFESVTEGVIKTILHPIETVKAKIRALANAVQESYRKGVAFPLTWMVAKKKVLQLWLESVRSLWNQKVVQPYRAMQKALEHKFKGLKVFWDRLSLRIFLKLNGLRAVMMNYTKPRWSWSLSFPSFKVSWNRFARINQIIADSKNFAANQVKKVQKYFEHKLKMIKAILSKALQPVKKLQLSLINYLQTKLAIAKRAFRPVRKFSARIARSITRRFRFLAAWSNVLLRYGMRQVTLLADRVG